MQIKEDLIIISVLTKLTIKLTINFPELLSFEGNFLLFSIAYRLKKMEKNCLFPYLNMREMCASRLSLCLSLSKTFSSLPAYFSCITDSLTFPSSWICPQQIQMIYPCKLLAPSIFFWVTLEEDFLHDIAFSSFSFTGRVFFCLSRLK